MLKRIRNLLNRREKKEERKEPEEGNPSRAGGESAVPPGAETLVAPRRPPVHRGPDVVHHPIPIQDLDPDAVKIVRRLTRFDHTAYLVGGCVRDLLLGHRPKDYDIGTSATPRQVKRLFSNCRIIGRRFRLAHVYFAHGKFIEVATFRARDAEDAEAAVEEVDDLLIREDNVFGTPEEDALRRDFTINALFYDVNGGNVLDHADGLGDLRRRLVRTIGDAEIRFREDPIRILRAIRFAAKLDFTIEPGTLEALRETRVEIPRAASPRILEEINRLCRGGTARKSFDLLIEHEVLDVIIPELTASYRKSMDAARMLTILMDAVDRRRREDREISTGEILAVLLFPVLSDKMGWRADGRVSAQRGPNGREMADELLRPLALRLRVARRDQERCRQIVSTLQRLVPAHDLRRAVRMAILRRPHLEDALWILDAIAARYGGEYSRALQFWTSAGLEPAPADRAPEHAGVAPGTPAVASGSPPGGKRRRGRRRRPAGAPASAGSASPASVPPATAEPAKAALPPPWDDNYFFAALPSVPRLDDAGPDSGDRYGASSLASDKSPAGGEEGGGEPSETRPPAGAGSRRKRRSRRRRRPVSGPGTASAPAS